MYSRIFRYLSVVVVPSLNLIAQFKNDYLLNAETIEYNLKYFNRKYELLTICSENEINDFESKCTTNKKEISDFLKHTTKKIILITYQSLTTLTEIIKKNKLKIDMLCFDEAHHILADKIKQILFNSNDDFDDEYNEGFIDEHVNKTLFFTATP